ncbi:AAA family ATPase [Nocardia sp. NPDC050799]|uniref:AAA family ATPase n=1 Tax=Nocardia sp. NPDC050799 TaxID=3154842 RepID=UPI0033C05755
MWLNGPFGAGKTSAAGELVSSDPGWRLFDPEFVGFALRSQLTDLGCSDFQDLGSWRRLVPVFADDIARETHQDLVVVQTVVRKKYWTELVDGFHALGYSLRMVLIEASEQTLRRRICEDEVLHRAADWRLQNLAPFFAAREEWMTSAADLIVDTTSISPRRAAEQIAAAIGKWAHEDTPGGPS